MVSWQRLGLPPNRTYMHMHTHAHAFGIPIWLTQIATTKTFDYIDRFDFKTIRVGVFCICFFVMRTLFGSTPNLELSPDNTIKTHTTRNPPGHHRGTTGTPPGHHRDTTRTPPGHHRDTTGTPPGHHRDTTGTPPGHHRDTTRNPPGHHRDTTGTPPGHHRGHGAASSSRSRRTRIRRKG